MSNYLFMRNNDMPEKRVFFANPEAIKNKGGRFYKLSQKLFDDYGATTGKYYSYQALRPYRQRIAFVYYFNNSYLAIDKRKPAFNHNNNDTYICLEGNTDTLNAVTYGFCEDYAVLRRFNLPCLPDIPSDAKRIIFVRDANESEDQLIEKIVNKYNKELFKKIAFYTISIFDKTGFLDFSDWTDNSEIESNEELIRFLVSNTTHLNYKLLEASKTKEVA